MGTPSPDTVRERAHEIALIEGHAEATPEDWQQAKRELHGGHDFSDNGDAEMALSISERDMVASSLGHRAPTVRDDTEHAVEELIAEGMDEAEHDRMLESRRSEQKQDEE